MSASRIAGERVLLVSMPWHSFREPSLGVCILKAVLRGSGVTCDVMDAPLRLLKYVKSRTYDYVSGLWGVNDFVFTHVFEPTITQEQLAMVSENLKGRRDGAGDTTPHPFLEKVLRLRQEIIPRFLGDLLEDIDLDRYALIGLTCVADQTIPSLALARLIKQKRPDSFIAMGGAGLLKPVGPALQRSFPDIDVVAYGDGEPVIVPLLEAVCGERPFSQVPNITYRDGGGGIVESDVTKVIALDHSPVPDFDDFFTSLRRISSESKIRITPWMMPLESSRGCWWGAKRSCTFCSLDRGSRNYRWKSSAVVLSQLEALSSRYSRGQAVFRFNDSIMPLEYFHDFLPDLEKRGSPFRLLYEIKSNLTWDQIAQLRRAGIFCLQPGIESFSTSTLKLMRKGVTGLHNIFVIYAMMYHRIRCNYNLLWGTPGESVADVESMAKLLPSLYHMTPPHMVGPVQLVRFSEYVERPERYELVVPLRAHWRHRLLFSPQFRSDNHIRLEDM